MEDTQKLLVAKALDAVRICELRNIPKFVGFLSPGEASAIKTGIGFVNSAVFYGGYEEAERNVFGVLPDYLQNDRTAFPITVLKINFNKAYSLSHSDVLGALMSLGISRSTVGDILIFSGRAIVFVLDDIAEYIANHIDKIRNVGVTVTVSEGSVDEEIIFERKTEPVNFTVSSPRLDAVVSGLTGMGRSKAEQAILDGIVYVNSFEAEKPTKKVQQGDVISIRRCGKFKITGMGTFSKKGREIISAEKYK